jgi:hypothetical protein
MRCAKAAILAMGLFTLVASPAQAQWFGDFFHRFKQDFNRNNSWPAPFLAPDRESVNLPFEMMERNGWRKQTMVCDYHFESDTARLTPAGELKVRWILTQAPIQRRVIFVQRGSTPLDTAARIQAVQQVALHTIRAVPEIVETDIETYGWPADVVDAISKKRAETQPDPQLPPRSDSGSSSGGSGM